MSLQEYFDISPYEELKRQYIVTNLYSTREHFLSDMVSALNKSVRRNELVLRTFESNTDRPVQDVAAQLMANFYENFHENRAVIETLQRFRLEQPSQRSQEAERRITQAINVAFEGGYRDTLAWLKRIPSSNLNAEIKIHQRDILEFGHSATYSDDARVRQSEAAEARKMEEGLNAVIDILKGEDFVLNPTTEAQGRSIFVAYCDMLKKHFPLMQEEHARFIDEGVRRAGHRSHSNVGIECAAFYETAKKCLLRVGSEDVVDLKRELMERKNHYHEHVKGFDDTPGHSRAFQQQFIQQSYQKFLRVLTFADHEYHLATGQPRKKSTYDPVVGF